MYTYTGYNIRGAIPLLFTSPCWFPFAPLSSPLLLTWNPPSCDRIHPPWSQVACKLTSPFSTLSPIPPWHWLDPQQGGIVPAGPGTAVPGHLLPHGLHLRQSLCLPLPYQFVRYLQARHPFVQILAATLYEFEDVCWQAPSLLGFCLNVLDDGIPVLSQERRIPLDEFLLGLCDDGVATFHGRPNPLDFIQAFLSSPHQSHGGYLLRGADRWLAWVGGGGLAWVREGGEEVTTSRIRLLLSGTRTMVVTGNFESFTPRAIV